jgi:hypothetical protein
LLKNYHMIINSQFNLIKKKYNVDAVQRNVGGY